jgi:hypothetical protein
MAIRCCLYQHKAGDSEGKYFVVCTSDDDCPDMPDATKMGAWSENDCDDCKVPAGYPTPKSLFPVPDPSVLRRFLPRSARRIQGSG